MMQKICSRVIDGKMHIMCPECGRGLDGKVKDKIKSRVVVCCPTCASKFVVQLDYRRQYRRPVSFSGICTCTRVGSFPVTIEYVSRNGVRFQVCKSKYALRIDEYIGLQFQLDDKNNSDIQVVVKICNWDGKSSYGGSFVEKYLSTQVNRAIGFWLM